MATVQVYGADVKFCDGPKVPNSFSVHKHSPGPLQM